MKNKPSLCPKARFLRAGQSISEYMFILGIVTASLIGMQVYMKRGIQAVINTAADELGMQEGSIEDIEKGTKTNSTTNTISDITHRKRGFAGGSQQIDIDEDTNTTGEATYVSEQEK